MTKGRTYLTLFLIAVPVRAIYLLSVSAEPTFHVPLVDSATYLAAAEAIAGGAGLPPGALRFGPLYPLILGAGYAITGGSLVLLHLFQILITSLAAPLAAAVGAKIFGRTEGFLAGLLVALYWPFIYFDGEFLIEPVLVPLILLLLLALLRCEDEKGGGRARDYFAAGLLVGWWVYVPVHELLHVLWNGCCK